MKKVVGLVLVLAMLAGCLGGIVFADEGLEGLVLSVKERLNIPDEYTALSTARYSGVLGETISLEWRTEDEKNFISAEVNQNGVITNYSTSTVRNSRGISKFTKEQAVNIAKEWFGRVNPDIANEYVFDVSDVYMGYGITVSAERYAGEARIVDDSLSIRLNDQTGEISDMNLRYTDEKFQVPENIISKEEAKTRFGDNTNLMLAYLKSGEKAIPVYIDYEALYEPMFGIDAVTGEKVNIERSYFREAGGAYATNEALKEMAADAELTPQEIEEISKYDSYISETDGAEKIKAISEFGIADYNLERYSYQKQYTAKEADNTQMVVLSLTFRKENAYAYGELDAATGEILSFFCNPNETRETAVITSAQAEQAAKSLAEKTAGDKICKMVISIEQKDELTQEIAYLEMINGIPYLDSGMNITVDKTSGTVTNYSADWNKEEIAFEGTENVIANNMAHKVYSDGCEYELAYVDISTGDAIPYSQDGKPYEYVLVYQITKKHYCVDAYTGAFFTEKGETEKEPAAAYEDLKGHWAEDAINTLIDNGYLEIDENNFRPNDSITYKEARNIMRSAGIYNVFGESNDKTMTREEAVKAMMCSAGYEKAGAISGIYVPVFGDWNDIAEENRGYIALAKGFGIISGDQNGYFNPKANMTRGAFAVMVYNYISSGLLD